MCELRSTQKSYDINSTMIIENPYERYNMVNTKWNLYLDSLDAFQNHYKQLFFEKTNSKDEKCHDRVIHMLLVALGSCAHNCRHISHEKNSTMLKLVA